MGNRAYFISDLHLFSNRSVGDQYVSEFRAAASKAHTFVLGGDIFDFKSSRLGSFEKTVAAGRRWIEDFIHPYPDCQFHFLSGNNDANHELSAELKDIERQCGNFSFHPHWLRLESCVFVHGDVCDGFYDQSGLEAKRARLNDRKSSGRLRNIVYDTTIALRVYRFLSAKLNPAPKATERLCHYLDSIEQGASSGTRFVYFGHTHNRLIGFENQGMKFYNCGATIKTLPFEMLEIGSLAHTNY